MHNDEELDDHIADVVITLKKTEGAKLTSITVEDCAVRLTELSQRLPLPKCYVMDLSLQNTLLGPSECETISKTSLFSKLINLNLSCNPIGFAGL